ncbi:hypothetical protein ElyMa_004862600 [Elysia marginata]|uniref:Uncharacterized protein n=1 Tax=Elysia marginata TaxID=1093978 RepID=A0AAV4ISC8_9GAST|nr:hypothetical protein ElyMa_004862600 [Elysia marginata]
MMTVVVGVVVTAMGYSLYPRRTSLAMAMTKNCDLHPKMKMELKVLAVVAEALEIHAAMISLPETWGYINCDTYYNKELPRWPRPTVTNPNNKPWLRQALILSLRFFIPGPLLASWQSYLA